MSAHISSERNQGVDILRLVAAFSVVTLHIEPVGAIPGDLLGSIWMLARYAIPAFFMITGFFSGDRFRAQPDQTIQQLARVAGIFIAGIAIYIPFQYGREGIHAVSARLLSFAVLTGGTCYHLWFLSSLFFGILFLALWHRAGLARFLFLPSLVIGGVYLAANYYQGLTDEQFMFLRYLSSIPLIYLGMVLRRRMSSIQHHGIWIAWLLIALGVSLQFLESDIGSRYFGKDPRYYQLLLGSIPYAAGMLILACSIQVSPPLRFLAIWGREHSLGIYVMHIWFVTLVKKVYAWTGVLDATWSALLMAPLVFAVTLSSLILWKKCSAVWRSSQPVAG